MSSPHLTTQLSSPEDSPQPSRRRPTSRGVGEASALLELVEARSEQERMRFELLRLRDEAARRTRSYVLGHL